MNKVFFYSLVSFIFCFVFFLSPVHAATSTSASLFDSDHDGLPDDWEVQVFHTDPNKADTDGDGYDDFS
jgi:hypothetical protein